MFGENYYKNLISALIRMRLVKKLLKIFCLVFYRKKIKSYTYWETKHLKFSFCTEIYDNSL